MCSRTALFAELLAVRANSTHSCPKRRYFSAVLIRECPTRLCNAVGPMVFQAPVGASKTVSAGWRIKGRMLVVRQAWARFLPARTYPHAPRDDGTAPFWASFMC